MSGGVQTRFSSRWREVREILHQLGPVAPLALAMGILPAVGAAVVFSYLPGVAPWLRERGLLAMLLQIFGFTLLAGLGLVPTYANAILGGWAHGAVAGICVAQLGVAGASSLGYWIGMMIARDRVMALMRLHEPWDAIRVALVGGSFWKTVGIVAVMRMAPAPPFSMSNLILSSLNVRYPAFLLGTVLGLLPQSLLLCTMASGMREIDFNASRSPWLIAGGIASMIIVLIILGMVGKRALNSVTRQRQPAG